MQKILAIDDDIQFLNLVADFLKLKGFEVDTTPDPLKALGRLVGNSYDCVLLDVKMPGQDGIALLQQLRQQFPELPVVMLSGQSTLSIAVNAIKLGAFDFIEKGGDTDRLLITIQNAINQNRLISERKFLLNEILELYQMVGVSPAMKKIFSQIETIAPTTAKVFITGETGTGKELVARAIHLRSHRSSRPFVKVNCAAIPETLIESTFFGHAKGSFTGAIADKPGKFEQADNGTIFLDEVGELPLLAQAKLLTALQDGEIEKIGSRKAVRVDVRVIAATNKDIQQMLNEGSFREDLFHRLNTFHIHIPPLRERPEDIPPISEFYLKKFADIYNKPLDRFSEEAMWLLVEEQWSGNVRMLKNVIEKVAIFSHNSVISPEEVAAVLEDDWEISTVNKHKVTLSEFLENQERQFLKKTLLACRGNRQAAAEMLGIDRATLWRKLKKHELDTWDAEGEV
ncbi:MAG: sigma-54 dependent transcriptional regulator [Calditrichia bacterium]